jgi:uncharacterized surface protein with fasciclin (FAS1) repeats
MRKVFLSLLGIAALAATPTYVHAADKDIVATAVAAGSFTTLTKLVTAAGLVETLQGPGPFTVFAPTDAAFAKVPAATMEALGKDPALLKSVLLYHVVPGKVLAADVVKLAPKAEVATAGGKKLTVTVMNGVVKVDEAKVVQTDIMTSNGVIHVIDAVVIPK